MEQSETNNIEHQIEAESPRQHAEMLEREEHTVVQRVDKEVRTKDYQAVQQQDAPIRQRVSGEIPIRKFLNHSHILFP